MTDKEWLLELADKLSQENVRWFKIENTIAKIWVARLRAIAEKIDDD